MADFLKRKDYIWTLELKEWSVATTGTRFHEILRGPTRNGTAGTSAGSLMVKCHRHWGLWSQPRACDEGLWMKQLGWVRPSACLGTRSAEGGSQTDASPGPPWARPRPPWPRPCPRPWLSALLPGQPHSWAWLRPAGCERGGPRRKGGSRGAGKCGPSRWAQWVQRGAWLCSPGEGCCLLSLAKSGSPGGWVLNSPSNPSWGPDSGLHEALEGGWTQLFWSREIHIPLTSSLCRKGRVYSSLLIFFFLTQIFLKSL